MKQIETTESSEKKLLSKEEFLALDRNVNLLTFFQKSSEKFSLTDYIRENTDYFKMFKKNNHRLKQELDKLVQENKAKDTNIIIKENLDLFYDTYCIMANYTNDPEKILSA